MRLGLHFEQAIEPTTAPANRADVALFVGFVRQAEAYRTQLPAGLARWLRERGWLDAPGARSEAALAADLRDVPVPIDDWATFDALFDWRTQSVASDPSAGVVPTYLGAAVRSFFAQGGRRCYVVRVGDPLALRAPRADRLAATASVVPSVGGDVAAESPRDRMRWRGLAHLHELEEVSFVCLPDLPWLVAQAVPEVEPPAEPDVPPETFIECSDPVVPPPATPQPPPVAVPRCVDEAGYRDWAYRLHLAVRFIARHRPDTQLLAAIPLPAKDSDAGRDLFGAFVRWGLTEAWARGSGFGLSSAYLQLAYPWWRGPASVAMPGSLEPPDGALAGILARSTLLQGSYKSAAGQPLYHARAMEPEIDAAERLRLHPLERPVQQASHAMQQRISLLGPSQGGFSLLSDVTTSVDEAYRPASINRLTSVWVRAARRAGEPFVFEPSGEALWSAVRARLQLVGQRLFTNGALRGANPSQAFRVRCDRSTMSQGDIDGGRLVAEVTFRPAVPIESIRVAFALDESQRVSILSEEARA